MILRQFQTIGGASTPLTPSKSAHDCSRELYRYLHICYIERGLAVNYRDNATVFSLLNSLKKLVTFGNVTTGFSANDI